jgi:lysophospholipase L1-like esterase
MRGSQYPISDERALSMKIASGFLVCVIAASSGMLSQTKTPSIVTEKIEWTWADRPEHPNEALPNVLLLGDSITRAYYPETAKELDGVANVYLFATSCSSGDPRLVGQVNDYFGMTRVPFSVVHFNNGMHGWGYSEAQYSGGLPGLISALRAGAPEAKLIWTTTTPIRKDAPDERRTNARIDERNRLAAAAVGRDGVSIDDQHALMTEHQDMHGDDVHFSQDGSALQAKAVAASIRKILK